MLQLIIDQIFSIARELLISLLIALLLQWVNASRLGVYVTTPELSDF